MYKAYQDVAGSIDVMLGQQASMELLYRPPGVLDGTFPPLFESLAKIGDLTGRLTWEGPVSEMSNEVSFILFYLALAQGAFRYKCGHTLLPDRVQGSLYRRVACPLKPASG